LQVSGKISLKFDFSSRCFYNTNQFYEYFGLKSMKVITRDHDQKWIHFQSRRMTSQYMC